MATVSVGFVRHEQAIDFARRLEAKALDPDWLKARPATLARTRKVQVHDNHGEVLKR